MSILLHFYDGRVPYDLAQLCVGAGWTVGGIKQHLPREEQNPNVELTIAAMDRTDVELTDDTTYAALMRHRAGGLLMQRKLSLEGLLQQLPAMRGVVEPVLQHCFDRYANTTCQRPATPSSASMHVLSAVLTMLHNIPYRMIDVASIKSVPANVAAVDCPFDLIEDKTREVIDANSLPGEMYVTSVLPNDAGVTIACKHVFHYRAASDAYVAEVKAAAEKRTVDIAHCEKLLLDLPVALANSQAAMESNSASEAADLNELGAMVIEQKRITRDITTNRTELARLQAMTPPALANAEFTAHTLQPSASLVLGLNHMLGSRYQLVRRVNVNVVELGWIVGPQGADRGAAGVAVASTGKRASARLSGQPRSAAKKAKLEPNTNTP